MTPAVSVVIPTYDRLPLLREAVDSVFDQSYGAFELLVVDDASGDGTADWLRNGSFAADHRLRPILLREHLGTPGAVRNRGAEAARAPLLAFLDSDDRWLPEKLARQLPLHIDGACRISHTRELWLREGRRVSQKGQKQRRRGDIFEDALKKCIIGPSTTVIDTELFRAHGGFDEELEVAEDYELWLRIAAFEKVCYLEESLTEKRAGAWEQLSEKYGQIEGFRIEALRRVLARQALPAERATTARSELARKLRIFAVGARKRGREAEARAVESEAAELETAIRKGYPNV